VALGLARSRDGSGTIIGEVAYVRPHRHSCPLKWTCPVRKSGALFDHLVGERQQGRGHDDAERLRGLQVDEEIELLRPLYR